MCRKQSDVNLKANQLLNLFWR